MTKPQMIPIKTVQDPNAQAKNTVSNYLERPVLAFIDADIVSGKDEIAREGLLNNLSRYRTRGVSPLWVNWLRQRADLRPGHRR